MSLQGTSQTFIGRTSELNGLEEAFADACAGRARAVVLGGEAGVGKSRLVAEFARVARDRGARVLVGGAIDVGEGGLPYVPIIEALRPLGEESGRDQLLETLGSSADELAPLLPRLRGSEASMTLVDGFAQARLFERLLALFEGLSRTAPLVLVLEDLHWADRSTRDLLAYLVRNLGSRPVLLIGTYRTDELHPLHPLLPMLAELTRSRRVTALAVPRFTRREHAAHLASLLGHEAPAATLEATFARTDGNPFFTEELLADRGASAVELPTTLREVLLARYRTCPAATRAVLRAASVARTVSHPLLARVSGLPDAELLEALRDGVDRAIVVANPESARYGFRHALMAEAIYDDLLPGERSRLHAAFAAALARDPSVGDGSGAGAAAELAHHWLMAHNVEEALPAFVAAGRAAQVVHAHPEALHHFERALELVERVPNAEALTGVDVPGLAELAALAAEANGDFGRAVDLWRTAIEGVDAGADPVRAGFLWVGLGETEWLGGDLPAFVEARRRAVELVPDRPGAERAMVLAKLASALTLSSDLPGAARMAREAIETARAARSRDAEGRALAVLGSVSSLSGQVEEAVSHLSAALDISRELGKIGAEANDRSNLAGALHLAGRLEEGIAVLMDGIERVRANGMDRTYAETMTAIAIDLCNLAGDWDRAQQLASEAQARQPAGVAAAWLNLSIAEFAAWKGGFEASHAALAAVAKLSRTPRVIGWSGPHEQMAQLALWEGRNAAALRHVFDGLDQLDAAGAVIELSDRRWLCMQGLWAAADVARDAGARADRVAERAAREAADRLEAQFAEHAAAVRAYGPSTEPHLVADESQAAAEHARAHGRHDPATWARVADAWRARGHLPAAGVARWREAEAHLLAGEPRAAAAAPLRAAATMARQLGAQPLLARVEALARRARIVLSPAPAPHEQRPADRLQAAGLTPREREVLDLLAKGRSNRQIAAALFISDKTASVHVTNIKAKLGAASRIEAAAMAFRLRRDTEDEE